MKIRYTALCLAALLASAADAFPQLYPFHNYTPSRGLSQSTINAIYQDDKGYLWFATGAGVSRFDGLDFEVFNSSNGLADDCVYCILQDSSGSFWFGTYRGVSRFDGKNWSRYEFDQTRTNCKVFSALEDSRGNIWFGSDDGVRCLRDGQWKHYTVGDGLVDNYVNAILEDGSGSLWFATKHGLSKFAGDKWTSYRVEDGLPDNSVNSIVQDRKGFFWAGTVDGVGRYDGESWQTVLADGNLVNRDVRTVYEDSRGNLWFGLRGGGVVKFDGANWKTFTAANGLVHNRVTAIFEDREKNMWFGTERGGVSQLTGEAFCHYRVLGDKNNNGISGNLITSLLEDSRRRIWVGTCMGGVSVFDGRKWSSYSRQDGLASNCVTSIREQGNGDFWAGTDGGGICRFDGKRWAVVVDRNKDFEEDRINKIIEDNRGSLWFATKRGALKFDGKTWSAFTVEDGLAGSVVNDILQTTDGLLWFATEEGVSCFDGTKWKTFTRQDGLAGDQVFDMFEDNHRNLWFGTSEGVSKYDGKSFQNLTVEDGLSSKFCYFIIGYKNYLFIGTGKGIDRYDGQSFRVYSAQEGLSSNEMTMGACLKDSHGKLWFGTTSGLTRFDPELDRENITPPPVYITSITAGDTALALDRPAVLGHDRNRIKFDFVSLCFTAPEKLIYSYKLEGWDTAWEETEQRSLRYSHLPSGDYTFKVRARNSAGIWSESPAEYHFTLTPPLWETAWFRILALLILAGLVVAAVVKLYKARVAKELAGKNGELENMMHELEQHRQEREKSHALRTREEQAGEKLFRVTAENVGEGIAVIQQGKVVFANKQFASMLGFYSEKLPQKDFTDLLCDDSRKEFAGLQPQEAPDSPNNSVKVVFRGNADKKVWSEIYLSRVEWHGEAAGLVTAHDISRQVIKELAAGDTAGIESKQQAPGAAANGKPSVFGEIVGKSAPMQAVYALIEKASKSSANVIVYGETGTGKEMVARTIHNLSQRSGKPFVVVNCGAIPSSLFESEFFGHRKGAFTGAYQDKRGFFDVAEGGTLFLDEVGELDASMQVKLLRAVEGEGYSPVGGGDMRKSDVRIIGATNRDLSTGVKNGEMRSDFFYRMHIVPITLPPLRERREDIPLLLKYFISKHTDKSIADIPEDILEKLYNYDWPGNVRQLQNVILRYLTVGQFDLMESMIEKDTAKGPPHRTYRPDSLNLKEETEHFEKQVILEALKLTQGHKSKAAEVLGITRRTLFRKMKDYDLK